MPYFLLQVSMVVGTMCAFLLALALNEALFTRLEFTSGINWIFLPAGVRLLSTLLFAEAGALGLLLVSWLLCYFYFFPDDYVRSFVGGLLATAAPYLTYRIARHYYGMGTSLHNFSPRRLLLCAAGYAIASPMLHHIWFAMSGEGNNLVRGFLVMAAGDFSGTLIVLYLIKGVLGTVSTPHSGVS